MKWFPQRTDEAKPLVLLRKNLMNDQMNRTVFMADDVPFNPASYVSVILHCESLANLLLECLSHIREETFLRTTVGLHYSKYKDKC